MACTKTSRHFVAGGGGDTLNMSPKRCTSGLSQQLVQRQNALKLVYLVGDAPPHTDYQDGFDYRAIAKEAQRRGIRINTVRCGSDEDTRTNFTEIASLGGGDFRR